MTPAPRIARALLLLAAAALVLPACGSRRFNFRGPGVLQFLAAVVSAAENGAAGTVTLTVTRTDGASGAVSVAYATSNGSALSGSDYTTTNGVLNWAAGDSAPKSFAVPLTDDPLVEGDETFTVALSGPTGGALLGAAVSAVVTIQDDNAPPEGVLQFSLAVYPVNESDGAVSVTVNRSGGTLGAASVNVVDLGTGSATGGGTDYTFASPAALNWAAGVGGAQSTVILVTNDGPDAIPVEIVALQLQSAVGAVLGTVQDATVEITDADQAGVVQFTAAAYNVSESGVTGTITVTRTGGTLGPASVQVVDLGTGGAVGGGVDYTFASPVTVNWADGAGGPVDVDVAIVDDLVLNAGTLDVDFGLQNPFGAALGAPVAATLNILDDEAPPAPGTISFSGTPYSVNESAGTLTATLTRTGGTSGAVSVTVNTADITATSGATPANKQDYVPVVNLVVNWGDGDGAAKNVVITILNNDGPAGQTGDAFGGSETFSIDLSGGTGGVTISPASTTATIVDD
jgi:hypothetical protein